jgi:hypothetical protein
MKNAKTLFTRPCLTLAACACMTLAAGSASAQLAPNQTNGFGNGRLVTFTYLQNFGCVDQPTMDLDRNGVMAQSDPNEMQTPICQVVTEPTADPSGADIKHTAHLYVLVPMFSVDTDQNAADAMPCPNGGRPGELCGAALGHTLISLFGFVPEAWKTHPSVATQCPDPNNPVPGTCTMHASSVDLSQLLFATGHTGPPTGPVFLPTPNHSHVVDNSRVDTQPIWWEVRPVLVKNQGRLAIGRREQRDYVVESHGRCGSRRESGGGRLQLLPLLQLGNETLGRNARYATNDEWNARYARHAALKLEPANLVRMRQVSA